MNIIGATRGFPGAGARAPWAGPEIAHLHTHTWWICCLRMRRQRVHGHSSERPGMEDNAEAEQPSTGRGEDTLCRTTAQIAAAQHVITSSPSRVRGSARAR